MIMASKLIVKSTKRKKKLNGKKIKWITNIVVMLSSTTNKRENDHDDDSYAHRNLERKKTSRILSQHNEMDTRTHTHTNKMI